MAKRARALMDKHGQSVRAGNAVMIRSARVRYVRLYADGTVTGKCKGYPVTIKHSDMNTGLWEFVQ